MTERLEEEERSLVGKCTSRNVPLSSWQLQMITTGWAIAGNQLKPEATEDDRVARLFEHLKAQQPLFCEIGAHDNISPDQNAFKSHHQSWEKGKNPAWTLPRSVLRSRPTIDGFRIIRESRPRRYGGRL